MKQFTLLCTLIFATNTLLAANSADMVVVEAEREKGLYYCGHPGKEKFTFTPDVAQGCSAEILERYRVRQAKIENDKRENDVWITMFLAVSQTRQKRLDEMEVEIRATREAHQKNKKANTAKKLSGEAARNAKYAQDLAEEKLNVEVIKLTGLWDRHNHHYKSELIELKGSKAVGLISEESFYTRERAATAEMAINRRKQLQFDAARAAADEEARVARGPVRIGMNAKQVLASSWGTPSAVNKTTTAVGVKEQWVYGSKAYLYFDRGVLTTIQE